MLAHSALTIVDVREEAALLSELGHIHGVLHGTLESMVRTMARTAALVLVCEDGATSASVAASLVREHAFVDVYHLVGGMRRWNAEGRPIARKRTWQTVGQSRP